MYLTQKTLVFPNLLLLRINVFVKKQIINLDLVKYLEKTKINTKMVLKLLINKIKPIVLI